MYSMTLGCRVEIPRISNEPQLLDARFLDNIIVRIHKKVEKFGIHEYQKIWYAKS